MEPRERKTEESRERERSESRQKSEIEEPFVGDRHTSAATDDPPAHPLSRDIVTVGLGLDLSLGLVSFDSRSIPRGLWLKACEATGHSPIYRARHHLPPPSRMGTTSPSPPCFGSPFALFFGVSAGRGSPALIVNCSQASASLP